MKACRAAVAAALALFACMPAWAQGDGSSPTPAAAPAAGTDPDTMFKGRMGGTFGKDMVEVMPNARRIAVPVFRVAFVTENKVTAQVRGAYLPGRDMSGANSSLHVTLQGTNARTMQQVTDLAYATLLKELAASGREVVQPAELKELMSGFQVTPPGATKEQNGQTVAFFSPSGVPLVFMIHDGAWGSGGFDLTNYRKLEEISVKANAAVIAPLIVVNFAKMKSSGNQSGLVARQAETGAELAMSVAHAQFFYTRGTEFRNGMQMGGDQGSFSLTAPIVGSGQFGSIVETEHSDNAGLQTAFNLLGKRAGLLNAGGPSRSSTKAVANVNDQAYGQAATDVTQTLARSLAGWFGKHPPAGGGAAPAQQGQ